MTTTQPTNVHRFIDDLCRQASRLAPKAAYEALDSCNTNTRPTGPRQAKAWDLVAEAHRLNAISEDDEALAAENFHNGEKAWSD